MDDAKIVDLYLSRDEAAIEQTSLKYGSRLRILAYGMLIDHGATEECENDTYMEAWNTIPPNEPRKYFYAYLARITRHIALNYCRNRNRLKRSAFICELSKEMEECIPAPDDSFCRVNDADLSKEINRFLSTINKEKRIIFVRRYWYLDSISEISCRLGISESKVKTTLFRCRKELRDYLEKEGYAL